MIDWSSILYFNPAVDQFSEDPDKYADPNLIKSLDLFRKILGYPIFPSPAPGAIARLDDSVSLSQHYVGNGRLSTAIDIFTSAPIQVAWIHAISCGLWGGIGLYSDTVFRGKSWPMLHLDIRPISSHKRIPAMWFRDKEGYHSFKRDEDKSKMVYEVLSKL